MRTRRIVAGGFALAAVTMALFEIKLPPPFATPSAINPPRVIAPPPGAQLRLPQGFRAEIYARGFRKPRYMLAAPNGTVLLADSASAPAGAVWVLAAGGKSTRLIDGLERPYGLAFWNGYLYVGEPASVKRYPYNEQNGTVGKPEQVVSLAGLTADHWTRSLLFDRAGKKLYVGVGSGSNDSTGEDPRRAAINRYNPDGSGHEIFASGLRNPIGIHWYPGTDALWAAVQERDELGDDVVPDYFTPVQQGRFYGWPYAYIGKHPDPKNGKARPDLVGRTQTPEVVLQPAHVAVLDFAFYTGSQFPQEYRGGAFLALHGSWNRSKRVGYAVGFIPFRDGKPAGPMRDFLTGWMLVEPPEALEHGRMTVSQRPGFGIELNEKTLSAHAA